MSRKRSRADYKPLALRPRCPIIEETPVIAAQALCKRLALDLDDVGKPLIIHGVEVKLAGYAMSNGTRWLFECPGCRQRRRALYLLDSLACRRCHRLLYRCQARGEAQTRRRPTPSRLAPIADALTRLTRPK